jgi:acyl carrier protein
MSRDEAEKIIVSVLRKNVPGLELTEAKMDETLVDLGVDSLDIMLVIMEAGEAAGITIDDDEAEELDTPRKIVDFITGKSA